MSFKITENVHVRYDKNKNVRLLRHLQEPYKLDKRKTPTPRTLAAAYVREVSQIYGISSNMLASLEKPVKGEITEDGLQLRFTEQKKVLNSTVISYDQTYYGIPIWGAGLSVQVHGPELRVTSSQSNLHYDVQVKKPEPDEKLMPGQIEPLSLDKGLGKSKRKEPPKISKSKLFIYHYDSRQRTDPEAEGEEEPFHPKPPTLRLPKLPGSIKEDSYYVVNEVFFTLSYKEFNGLNWQALIEVETGAVLYLRALVDGAFGNVFSVDPLRRTGNPSITPCSPGTDLDPLTDVVPLLGLDPAPLQELSGSFREIQDTNFPAIAPPVVPNPPGNFSFTARSDEFAAVSAAHHMDALYRMVDGFGFDVTSYFRLTPFPIPIDHRGEGGGVNAHHYGPGTLKYTFGLCTPNCVDGDVPVGIAATVDVVIHEFGHSLLSNNIGSGTFSWAHGVGDSLAAIMLDPGSNAPDRFETFPWLTLGLPGLNRRHDRDVTTGWGWGGNFDTGSYPSTTILATTLFRAYRSTGGDSSNINEQQFAARYMTYLIVGSVGLLNPGTSPSSPDEYATALMDADTGTLDFEGHPGGAFHKIIRWSFEKQGLYQPLGAPTPVTTEGDPPPVDVFIDDGRNGEYPYQANFWNTQDIWNRLSPDGNLAHQTPVVGVTNYMYVRVQNRGTQTANNVVVRTYHCIPATGLVWPDDWQATTTPQLAAGSIPSNGQTVVGPFEWTPQVVGHECFLASASAFGDLSNADTVNGPIPHWRLVPYDNNIAQRNLAPVPGGGGLVNLASAFKGRRFLVRNPFNRTAKVKIEWKIPRFLAERKWAIRLMNPGGSEFTLGPRDSREVEVNLIAGEDFQPSDVKAAGKDAMIEFMTMADGFTVGGMSYAIDPEMKAPARELPDETGKPDCVEEAKKLLDCLNVPVPADKVKSVKIKRISIDIDFEEDC